MGNTPLKLEGTSGDLKEMTAADEHYLAYQAGLFLAGLTAGQTAQVSTSTTGGGTSIGSFDDTFYNQAVGTHPGTSLSVGTTTTTLYQAQNTLSETGIIRPLQWDDTLTGIQQMDDVDFNASVDRVLSVLFTNEYPGSFRLSNTSPGADWSVFVSSVYTDTRTDGSSVTYNLYKRASIAAPTAVRPLKLQSTSPIALKEMTDTEIKDNIGLRAANRIVSSANYIGAYQLLPTTAGPPVSGGTWVARGVATDTRSPTGNVNYTRNSTANFTRISTRNSTTNYAGDYIGDFAGNFTGNYIGDTNFTRISTNNSTTDFIGDFAGNFTGNYIGDTNFTRISSRNSTTDYIGDYAGNFTGNYIGDTNFARISTRVSYTNFTGDYTGNFTGNYVGNTSFARTSTRTSYRTSYRSCSGNRASLYYPGQAQFQTYLTPAQQWELYGYAGITVYFAPNDGAIYIGNFVGNYVGNFVGNYAGTRDYTRISTRVSYTNFTGDYTGNFTGNYLGTRDYTRISSRNSAVTFTGDFAGNFTGDFLGTRDYTRISSRNSTTTYTGDYAGNFTGDFVGTRDYTRASTRNSTTNFIGDYIGDFAGNFTGDFIGDFTGNFAGETILDPSVYGVDTIESYTLYVRIA